MIHEVSHGAMALAFGDRTALYEGRLTLNPLKHIDWFGSVALPLFLFLTSAGFMIGWAKPVPYNPYNLRNRRIGEPMIALAGPLSNIIVAVIFGFLIRILLPLYIVPSSFILILAFVVKNNIALAIFNLIPLPPLDGSKILFSFLPIWKQCIFSESAQKYGILILIFIAFFFPSFISPIISWVFSLITGLY
jgi:Zn-dependent protease